MTSPIYQLKSNSSSLAINEAEHFQPTMASLFTKGGGARAKQPSRKGSVADRIIQQVKVEKHQHTLPATRIGDEELENVYTFVYLGAEVAGDGNPEITIRH